MNISFLGQGISGTEDSVGSTLIRSFSDPEFDRFTCFSAFVSSSGMGALSQTIQESKQHIKDFNVFIGVDQSGTSREALQALLDLDIGASVYHTFSHIIFHPKIYLFEGKEKCRIILGSSNLTRPGLFQNIEASLVVNFLRPDEEGEILLGQIYGYLKAILSHESKNVQFLTDQLIQELSEGGIIPDEREIAEMRKTERASKKREETTGIIEQLILLCHLRT